MVEPAGAIGISALELNNKMFKGNNVGVLICGGNNDFTRMARDKREGIIFILILNIISLLSFLKEQVHLKNL